MPVGLTPLSEKKGASEDAPFPAADTKDRRDTACIGTSVSCIIFGVRVSRILQGHHAMHENDISRARIAATYERIRAHVRRTPVIEVDSADFGLLNLDAGSIPAASTT